MLAKAELQEQLLTAVLRTDRDGNLQIDEREANILILRMKNHAGVHFDEDTVRSELCKTGGSLAALMTIIRQIGAGDDSSSTENEEKLVKIDDDSFMESARSKSKMQLSGLGDSERSFM